MAKTSMIHRDIKRAKLAKKFAGKRDGAVVQLVRMLACRSLRLMVRTWPSQG